MSRKVVRSERSIQKGIRTWLFAEGFIVIKLTTAGRYGSSGWPDLLVLDNDGRTPLFLEVKTEFGQLTALQNDRMLHLIGKGYPCYVVRSLQDAKGRVESWRK